MANPKVELALTAKDETKQAFDAVLGHMDAMKGKAEYVKAGLAGMVGAIAGASFVGLMRSAIDAADEMGKMAEKAGVAVEEYSALSFAARKLDVDQETLNAGIKKLNLSIAEATAGTKAKVAMFEALGIAYKNADGSARKVVDVYLDLAKLYKGAEEGPVKIAYAVGLMGKAGEQNIPMLNKGADAIRQYMEAAQAAGKVIDQDTADAADRFNKNLEALQGGAKKLAFSLAKELLPDLTEVTNAMVEAKKESGLLYSLWIGLGGLLAKGMERSADAIRAGQQSRVRELEAFIKENQGLAAMNPARAAMLGNAQREVDQLKAKLAEGEERAKPKWTSGQDLPTGKTQLDARGLKPENNASALHELKQFTSELQRLEDEQKKLNGEGEMEAYIRRLTTGSLRELTEAHKAELLAVKGETEELKRNREMALSLIDTYKQRAEAMDAADVQFNTYNQLLSESSQEMQFQLSLVGKMSHEQELLTALRRADLDAQRQLAQLPDAIKNDPEAIAAEMERVKTLTDAHKQNLRDYYTTRRQMERDAMTGLRTATQNYLDMVGNHAAQVEGLISNAFRSMEDALVEFVTKGKLDFKSLADSIISDIVRIQIRQSITGPLAGALQSSGGGGMLDWIFNRGGSAGQGTASSYTGDFALDKAIGLRASGGPVAAGAPYIVGEAGPELFVPGASGSIVPNGALRGSAPNVKVEVINQGQPVEASTRAPRWDGNQWVLGVVLNAARTSGDFRNSLRAVMGAPA